MNEERTFEQAQRELERIVQRLEAARPRSTKRSSSGSKARRLYRFCKERLDAAEGKIEELAGRVEAAKP